MVARIDPNYEARIPGTVLSASVHVDTFISKRFEVIQQHEVHRWLL